MMRHYPLILCTMILLLTTFSVHPAKAVNPENAPHPEQKFADDLHRQDIKKTLLPAGEMIVVEHGTGEPFNTGSYSIRLYSKPEAGFRLGNFSNGQIRSRQGFVDKLVTDDLDLDGNPEIIVLIRDEDQESYISADAYSTSGGYLKFMGTFTDLPHGTGPVAKIRENITKKIHNRKPYSGKQCEKISKIQSIELPAKNKNVSINQIKNIAKTYGSFALAQKIEDDPPEKPFQSDGCSLWFGSWKGVSLYPACFIHDLKYWAGFPDEEIDRLIADAELMVDIACLTGSTVMAETMFQGTRLGGDEIYQRPFSWGFGREPE